MERKRRREIKEMEMEKVNEIEGAEVGKKR